MILVVAALVCVISVPLTGGELKRLMDLHVRWPAAAFGALALQIVITTLAPSGHRELHDLAHVASYALAAACLVANRRTAGVPLLAAGAGLNCLAILVNHGVMPASPTAMRLAGLTPAAHFANSAPLAHPHLLVIGDVVPVPGPWPLGNVMSVGDVLIFVGLLLLLHHACRRDRTESAPGPLDHVDPSLNAPSA